MLQLHHICKTYTTGTFTQVALDDVSVSFRDNEFVAILGPSGSGKTTLLNIVGGLDHYDSGDLVIDGISTEQYKDRDWDAYRNNRIGFVFQSYNLIPHQTVLSNVELALTLSGVSRAERRERALEALGRVGLAEHVNKKPSQLSGGQMRRVAIAGVLAMEPQTLVLDEPCAGLDPRGREEILGLISDLHRESGATIVMVSHSMDDVAALAERVIVMNHGKVAMDGTPREIFSRGEELRAIGLDVPQAVELAQKLREKGFDVPEGIYKIEEVRAAVEAIVGKGGRHA